MLGAFKPLYKFLGTRFSVKWEKLVCQFRNIHCNLRIKNLDMNNIKLFLNWLWSKGAAEIHFSNGEKPQTPGKPACCKHLVMTFKTLFEKGLLNPDLSFKSKI
jgi:hypothetical protein